MKYDFFFFKLLNTPSIDFNSLIVDLNSSYESLFTRPVYLCFHWYFICNLIASLKLIQANKLRQCQK